ncbi:hypothetical protein GHT07_13345 [Caenimonas koreensis DSM 17982]|uniref:Histidine kinase-, DNA gyrase B-, and HSP90-like ATPase n=1 Tax=Caenimonas koreensis DSM 17982 TaxID=1121255 RepID=A0A844B9J1_9BURK|nr:hypothetical protein [Caenimonas koreensis]MRD48269.1 hypothetical protein [Caenimonas koreensis DSM 17982]
MSSFTLYARALLAYSIHEHQEGHVKRIDVWITPRSFTVQDDGRGMGLHRDGYVTNLMGTICDTHGPVQLHGVGLSIVAASTPLLQVESRRDGKLWKQSFAWGSAIGNPTSEPCDARAGTRITVAVPPDSQDINAADVIDQISVWRALYPSLAIEVN